MIDKNNETQNTTNWRKTPVNITKIPSHISGKMYLEGIQEVSGSKGYITHDVSSALQKAGFGNDLFNKGKVSKKDFLKAVGALEQAGLINHKSGHASAVYKKLGSWEAWQKLRHKNIERRKKDYAKEALAEADAEQHAEDEKKKTRQLSGVSGEASSELGRAVTFRSIDRARNRAREMFFDKKDKRDYLDKVRSAKVSQQSWIKSDTNQWTGGNNNWSIKSTNNWEKK